MLHYKTAGTSLIMLAPFQKQKSGARERTKLHSTKRISLFHETKYLNETHGTYVVTNY